MKKINQIIKTFLSSPWFWIIGGISFLLVTQIVFSLPAPFKFMEAVWSAGDFISFVGTLVLGSITVYQTQKANDMSQKLMQIETDRYQLEMRPFAIVSDIRAYDLNYDDITQRPNKLYVMIGNCQNKSAGIIGIGMTFVNTTNSWISVEYSKAHSDSFKLANATSNQPNRKIRLMPGKEDEIVFYADKDSIDKIKGKIITFSFSLQNRFSDIYEETFDLIILQLSSNGYHRENELYCSFYVQNYQINRKETKK